MASTKTVIFLKWKISGRIEHFVNLGKLYSFYKENEIGIPRNTLSRKDLTIGFENDIVYILKSVLK